MDERVTETQVLIIGGGIVGTAVAREFSKYKVDVCLAEKEPAAGFGVSKGSHGVVHSVLGLYGSRIVKWFDKSIDLKTFLNRPLEVKEKLNLEGYKMMVELAPLLNVKLNICGNINFAVNDEEMEISRIVKEVIEGTGYKDIRLLDRDGIREVEPGIDCSRRVGGLYDPAEATLEPTEWSIAFAENARQNGAHILFNTEVKDIEEKNGYYLIKTNNGSIKTEFVVNLAGLFSDEIAAMVAKIDWAFILWEHQYLVLENRDYIHHILFEMGGPDQPHIMVPTPDGRILSGVTFRRCADKHDVSNTREGLEYISGIPRSFIPAISVRKDMIRSFRGLLHFNSRHPDDYLIYWPREKFLNYIVCPPGIGSAPTIALEIVRMLGDRGLDLTRKGDFNPYRYHEPRLIDLPTEAKNEKIKAEPGCGHIVCRCEKACEHEIREAVRNGATCLDEIKFRTRAGMGRCQGGFCTPHVLKIMSEELGVSPLKITLKGGDSYILKHEAKELIERGESKA